MLRYVDRRHRGRAIFFVLPHEWSAVSRVLTCWNFGVVLFLILIYMWMTRLTAQQICTGIHGRGCGRVGHSGHCHRGGFAEPGCDRGAALND
jgi:hypothetical protein